MKLNEMICGHINHSGQALLPPLTLRQKGLVPAAPARRACVTSTSASSARQTFPSGWTPAVKDCFGLHGHSAFGYVAKEKSGVGRKSSTSVGLTTDPSHWLQAGKTVDILRCASKSTDLLPPSALPRSLPLPTAMPTRPAMPAAVTSSPSPRPPFPWLADYRLAPVIVLPLRLVMFLILMLVLTGFVNKIRRSVSAGVVILLWVVLLYMEI